MPDNGQTLGDVWPEMPDEAKEQLSAGFRELQDEARELTHDREPWMAWWQIDHAPGGSVLRVIGNAYISSRKRMEMWTYERAVDDDGQAYIEVTQDEHLELNEAATVGEWRLDGDEHPDALPSRIDRQFRDRLDGKEARA